MEPRETLTILVIDDHRDSREVLGELLAAEGHQVTVAADAAEALAAVRGGRPPDLIFLDYVMPGMSAQAFLRELHGEPALARIPVVLLTGAENPNIPGVAGFLRKPLPFDKLHEIVARFAPPRRV